MNVSELRVAAEQALRNGDARRAVELMERVVSGAAGAADWLVLARARDAAGDDAGAGLAVDRALALAPHDLSALVAKADRLTQDGEERAASAYFAAALRYMPNYAKLAPAQQQELLRAKAAYERIAREFEDFLRAHLETQGFMSASAPQRFTQAVDILLGKKRAYVQAPRQFYYPELPQVQFYPRDAFDWIGEVEAAYPEIRSELENQINGRSFDPYLRRDPTRPQNNQAGMLENPAWGAKFLIKDGLEQAAAAECPHTMAAMAHAPAPRIKGRTPHALFSKLAAGAHIPPHTGLINVRLICHLGLIVPEGCIFRVGNDVRPWVEGACWVFDDTIDHEAWNRSPHDRYVLLFDIWRPELSEEERAAIASLCEAVDTYGGVKAPWSDS